MTVGPNAGADWAAVLSDLEGQLAAVERLLVEVLPPEPARIPVPRAWVPPALPSLGALESSAAAELSARAAALVERQQHAIFELAASLVLLRRHRDLIETLAPSNDRPRFVDQRA